MVNAVFIFGASCSGKSTLAKALHAHLGSTWTYLDRDCLIEQGVCNSQTADDALENRIKSASAKDKIIIDAQIPWRDKRIGELYILLTAPLTNLMERTKARSEEHKWTSEFTKRAAYYVSYTHSYLELMQRTKKFDCCLNSKDSTIQEEVDAVARLILNSITTKSYETV